MYSSSNANTFNWDKTTTLKFIKRRIKEDVNFNGKPNSATVGYMTIVQDLGIPITEKQARSKWQNLVYKYKELKRYLDGSDEGYDKAVNSWPFFDVLDKFFTKKQILSFHNSPDENDEFIKTNFLSNNGSPANNSSFHQDFSVVNTDWIKNEIIDENEENFETEDFNDEMAAYQHHHSQNLPNLMSANHSSVPGRPENLNRQAHNNTSNTNNNNNNNSNNHNNHVNNNNNINTSSNNNGHHNHNNHNNISNGNKMNNEDNHQFLKSCKYEDSAPSRDELKRKALKRRLHHDPVFPPNNSSSNGPTNPPPLFFPTTTPNNHPPPLAIIDPSDDNFDEIMFQPNLSDTTILKEIHEIKEVVLRNNEYIQNLNDRTKSIENKLDLVMATLQKIIERDQPKIKIEDNSNSSLSFPEEFKKFNGE